MCSLRPPLVRVGDGKKLGGMGVKTVVCFLLSTAIAIVLGVETGVTIQQTASAAEEVSMLDTLMEEAAPAVIVSKTEGTLKPVK